MKSINIRDARQRLSDIMDAAEQGQSILISRHGRDVAQVGPVQLPAGDPLPDLTAFRKGLRTKGRALSSIVITLRA